MECGYTDDRKMGGKISIPEQCKICFGAYLVHDMTKLMKKCLHLKGIIIIIIVSAFTLEPHLAELQDRTAKQELGGMNSRLTRILNNC